MENRIYKLLYPKKKNMLLSVFTIFSEFKFRIFIKYNNVIKYMFCLTAFFCAPSLFSQSIELINLHKRINDLDELVKYDKSKATYTETANWILDKLNKHYLVNYTEITKGGALYEYCIEKIEIKYFNASIVDKRLIITKVYDNESSMKLYGKMFSNKNNYYSIRKNIEIPIENIKSVHFNPLDPNNSLSIEYFDSAADGGTSNYCIEMNDKKEVDLMIRIIDAFIHIKHLVKPIKKEVF